MKISKRTPTKFTTIGALLLGAPLPALANADANQRVGGDADARLEIVEQAVDNPSDAARGKLYRSGEVSTGTKLPVGYPAPTPPGAIEIKSYPVVRRAEVSGEMADGSPNRRGFYPLFRHISREGIPMTAPVEMEYEMGPDGEPDGWTMAFLYESEADGPTGEARGGVVVTDAPPVTVLSLGVQGRGRLGGGDEGRAAPLVEWIESSEAWRRVEGAPVRVLSYNGPSVPPSRQWWEVQLVVEPAPENAQEE